MLLPATFEIKVFDEASLFAGKIHAILCRGWKSRVKDKDLYDYVFYLSKEIAFNQQHLRERLLQMQFIQEDELCGLAEIKQMLIEKFSDIDYEQAKQDVEPFIKNVETLSIWSEAFFVSISEKLRSV